MNEKFKLEKLNDTINVCISAEHRFGTDAFLLANFANPRKKDLVCDLGTGCGIIPMIMSKENRPKKVYGIDIQEQAIEQFKLSVENSTLDNEVIPMLGDLRALSNLEFGQFDLVTCNPPYKASNAGILSELTAEQIARHEVLCVIDDVCKAAKKLLKYGGRLCICQRPERLADVITAMKLNDIEPKLLRFVSKTSEQAPWLFLIEGKKSSKPFMKVMPNLYIYDGEEYTSELQAIYGK
ncbi:MAG: methyltransferase [Oscillospiraceae bacterium]